MGGTDKKKGTLSALFQFQNLILKCKKGNMDKWLPLIRQALLAEVARTNMPVSGSKLRAEVARLAKAADVEFPPSEFPKFSTLVEQFPNAMILARRKGMDFLVVPADRPELLAMDGATSKDSGSWLRIDVFDAFTKIPTSISGPPVYIPTTDQFVWRAAHQQAQDQVVEVPPRTLASEVAVRAEFSKSVDPEKAVRLMAALDSKTPLKEFTQVLQSQRLVSDWHKFRLANLIEQLKAWATDKGITWSPGWLDTPDSKKEFVGQGPAANSVTPKHGLAEFLADLSLDDLGRITVPLDIVLRLLEKR